MQKPHESISATHLYWIRRAEQTRRLAAQIKDPKVRREMEDFTLRTYAVLAEFAERRG